MDILIKHTTITVRLIDTGEIGRLKCFERNISTKHIAQINVVLEGPLLTARERFAGFLVHVVNKTLAVVDDTVDHRRVKDRLIAQHSVLDLLLALAVGSNIAIGTNQFNRHAMLVASQDRHDDRQNPVFARFLMFRMYLNLHLLTMAFCQLQQTIAELLHILGLHTIKEDGGRLVFSHYLSLLIKYRDGLILHIEGPHMHMPRIEDMCQTTVAATNGLGHFLLTETIQRIVS